MKRSWTKSHTREGDTKRSWRTPAPSVRGWGIGPSSNSHFKSSLLSYLPISLVFTPEKSQVWRVSIQVMISFGSIECQEAAKTTEAAARGDGGVMGNMCSIDDGCSQEGTPIIYLVIPSVLHISSPTNNIYKYSLQRDFMCLEDVINLIWVVLGFTMTNCMSERVAIELALFTDHTELN